MKEFTVKCTETCQACNGSGLLPEPDWVEFDAFLHSLRKEVDADSGTAFDEQTAERQFEFWREHGYQVSDWNSFATALPPETIECDSCFGEGIIVNDVSLVDALAELGVSAEVFFP